MKHRFYKYWQWSGFAILIIAYCYEYAVRMSPALMTHEILLRFSMNAAKLGWISAAFFLPYVVTQPVVGWLFDRFRFNVCCAIALGVCAAGCLFLSYSVTFWQASLCRALMGLGCSLSYVAAVFFARQLLSEQYFVFFDGLLVSLGMLLPLCFNAQAKYWIIHHGVSPLFEVYALAGGVIGGLTSFLLPSKHMRVGDSSKITSGIQREYRLIIKSGTFWSIALIGFSFYLSLSLFAGLWGPAIMHHLYGLSKITSVTVTNAVLLGWVIGSPLQMFWVRLLKYRYFRLYRINAVGAVACLLLTLAVHASSLTLYILLFCFGFFCSVQITVFAAALKYCKRQKRSYVLAFMNTCMMSSALVQPASGQLMRFLSSQSAQSLEDYSSSAYLSVMVIMMLFLVSSLILACFSKDEI